MAVMVAAACVVSLAGGETTFCCVTADVPLLLVGNTQQYALPVHPLPAATVISPLQSTTNTHDEEKPITRG